MPCRQRPQQAPEWCMEVRVWGMSWQGSILCQVWDVKIVGRRRLQLPLPSSWIRRSAPAPAAGAYWPNGRGVKIPHPSSIFPRYVLKYGSAATLPACAQSWLLLPMRTRAPRDGVWMWATPWQSAAVEGMGRGCTLGVQGRVRKKADTQCRRLPSGMPFGVATATFAHFPTAGYKYA